MNRKPEHFQQGFGYVYHDARRSKCSCICVRYDGEAVLHAIRQLHNTTCFPLSRRQLPAPIFTIYFRTMVCNAYAKNTTHDKQESTSLHPRRTASLSRQTHDTRTPRPEEIEQVSTFITQSTPAPLFVSRRSPRRLALAESESIETFENELDSLVS